MLYYDIFNSSEQLKRFQGYLNSRHVNIYFATENEKRQHNVLS